ncbi:MAG: response regulator [Vulcanibacillus sp.]
MENKRILIVDDKYGIRLLLSEVFNNEGYQVFQAANGRTAIEIARNEKPDIVILDMKIPGMDGLEILRNIRTFDSGMKVVMMTAYGELDMLEEAFEFGVLKHFIKPFNINDLKIAIREIFQLELENQDNRDEKAMGI